MQMQACYAPVF